MKVEIDSGNLLTLQILAAVLQTNVATVTNDCIGWHLTLPLGNRGVSFLAEKIAGWPFDSEQDAIRGGWRVRIEQSNGGGWSPVVSDSH